MSDFASTYLAQVRSLLDRLDTGQLERALAMLDDAWRDGRQMFVMGNGGSAATASHVACDLARAGRPRDGAARPGLRVLSLTDNLARVSAIANDHGYDRIFVDQLDGAVAPGDLVVGISASGNSANVVRAFELAAKRGARTLALVGFDGGRLMAIADCAIHVQSREYGPVEDIHLVLNHLFAGYLATRSGATPPGGSSATA
jgi:D-sedoheptulose 7-phosphate isomerase